MMLTKPERTFTIIFMVILLAELICGSVESLSQLHYITKPMIVLSLIVFFWRESKLVSSTIRNLTLTALLFSLIGDVLLMFVDQSPQFFMGGLVAFLMAHVMYILVFLKHRNHNKKTIWPLVILDIYGIGLFLFLKDHLGEMLIPVMLYMIVILTMATTSFLREGKVSKTSYNFVLLGAVLFMISDSFLAINKFYDELPFGSILIMVSYALAQYFIVFGIKKTS